ncbi:MAG: hypothetical protein HY721_32060 [Planctomycetes bacterium]|nr:hypothetical protein [Planctomycetota bacterium]
MDRQKLRETIRAKPFRPFWLCMADGRELYVAHPEMIFISLDGRLAFIDSPTGDTHIVDPSLATGVSYKRASRRQKAAKRRRSA